MEINELSAQYSLRLEQAQRGDDKAAIELISELREALAQSQMQSDAMHVLDGLLARVSNSKSLRTRVIPEQTKRFVIAERNTNLVSLVQIGRALGFTLGTDGTAFEFAASQYQGDVQASAARTAFQGANKQRRGTTHGAIELAEWWPRMASLIAHYQKTGMPDNIAIENAVRTVHDGLSQNAIKQFSQAWQRYKNQVTPESIADAMRVFRLK